MVLTMPVQDGRGSPRRSLLAAGAAGALALTTARVAGGAVAASLVGGCAAPDLFDDPPAAGAIRDAEALRAVAADSLALAAALDRAAVHLAAQAPRLTPLRDAHREHAAAIARSLDRAPQPSASAGSSAPADGDPAAALKALAATEWAAAERAAATCVQVAAHHAPLIGAIAAARASHAEALS